MASDKNRIMLRGLRVCLVSVVFAIRCLKRCCCSIHVNPQEVAGAVLAISQVRERALTRRRKSRCQAQHSRQQNKKQHKSYRTLCHALLASKDRKPGAGLWKLPTPAGPGHQRSRHGVLLWPLHLPVHHTPLTFSQVRQARRAEAEALAAVAHRAAPKGLASSGVAAARLDQLRKEIGFAVVIPSEVCARAARGRHPSLVPGLVAWGGRYA